MNADKTTLLIERIEPTIVRLSIRRPPANAVDSSLLRQLLEALRECAAQSDPPAIVLTGAGDRFFSAGGDIKEVQTQGSQAALSRMETFHAVLCALAAYPAPLVGAVRGYAVGGGLEFLLFADAVIAGRNAQFGFPEINNGLLPAAKGMQQAVILIGRRAARTLLYSGRLVNAERACELGIADEVVEVDDVDARAVALAREMRGKDPHLFAAIKRTLADARRLSDTELEKMTIDDMRAYLDRGETAEARSRFLNRK